MYIHMKKAVGSDGVSPYILKYICLVYRAGKFVFTTGGFQDLHGLLYWLIHLSAQVLHCDLLQYADDSTLIKMVPSKR